MTTIKIDAGVLEKAANALDAARKTFNFYVEEHRKKGSTYDKIKRNEDIRDLCDEALTTLSTALLASSTPSSNWRKNGEPDPHGVRFDCERAKLMGGDLTDDELANAVFMDPTRPNIMAAQERIRWLSRQLESALSTPSVQEVTVDQIKSELYTLLPEQLRDGRGYWGDIVKAVCFMLQKRGLRIVRGEGEK